MAMMSAARERGLPYVYLGYFVEGCRSLEYKSRFRPNEVLSDGGAWIPFTP
jgi:arginine-tRNA-protein transferase